MTLKAFRLVLILIGVGGLAAGAAASGYAPAAPRFAGWRKVIAPPGVLDPSQPGVRLWHDYGAFALYAVAASEVEPLGLLNDERIRSGDEFDTLYLDAYTFNPLRETPATSDGWAETSPEGFRLHLIQFVGPIKDEWLAQVGAAGATLVHYLANHGYLVWADAAARARLDALARAGDVVQYSAPYRPYFKLGRTLRMRAVSAGDTITLTVQMLRHPGQALTEAFIAARRSGIVAPWSAVGGYQNATLRVPAAALPEIVARPDVIWVGEYFPYELLDEVQTQILAGHLDAARAGPSGPGYLAWLTGLGFSQDPSDYAVVDITDSGLGDGTLDTGDPTLHRLGEAAEPTRVAYLLNCTGDADGRDVGGHGHINASIALGYDARSGAPFKDADGFSRGLGVNPFGRLAATRLFNGLGQGNLDRCGHALSVMVRQSYLNGARILSNSWGCPGCVGAYGPDSQFYDYAVRDADAQAAGNQAVTAVFAAGNNGPGGNSINTPSNAKNIITVGGTESDRPTWTDGCGQGPGDADNAMDIVGFSSRGPAPGGRVKPEVVAPAAHIQGAASTAPDYIGNSVCDQYLPDDQTTFAASSGTSHSTPAVSGAVSLIDYWLRNELNVAAPSPAMLKAYLIAHTTYLTGTTANDTLPSPNQGFGLPDLTAAFDAASRRLVDQTVVFDSSGETYTLTTAVADASKPLRIVLAYTDQPGAVGAAAPQVNDLNLSVRVGDVTYLGNGFAGRWSVAGGAADTANNVEAVFLPAGATGAVTVTVTAFNIAGDGVPAFGDSADQDFALVCYNCAQTPGFEVVAAPADQAVCATASAAYTVQLPATGGFNGPVTLSAGGAPSGTNPAFNPNPAAAGGASTLTVSDLGAAPAGAYRLVITGTASLGQRATAAWLRLDTAAPGAITLQAPEDGATDVNPQPDFAWAATPLAGAYVLEVAADPDFADIVYQTGVAGAAHTPASRLALDTTYYWRVRTANACGERVSPTARFTTIAAIPVLLVDDDWDSWMILFAGVDVDARDEYVSALADLKIAHDVWDVEVAGVEPGAADLAPYAAVIWFTGDAASLLPPFTVPIAGPDAAGEAALAAYLDGGRCLLISSADYHYDFGLTEFMQTYLGTAAVTDDVGQASVTGAGVFGELGPYAVNAAVLAIPDRLIPAASAQTAFTGSNGGAGVAQLAAYRTAFLGFGLERLSAGGRAAVLGAFLDWCAAGMPGTGPTPRLYLPIIQR